MTAGRIRGAAALAAIAALIGVAAGVAELGVLAFDVHVKHRLVGFHIDSLWMKPVAEAAWFATLAFVVGLAAGRWPGTARAVPVLMLSLALFSLQWTYHRRLHWMAAACLATGVADQLWRVRERWPALIRRRGPALAGALGAVVVGLGVCAAVRGSDQGASRLRPPDAARPNVLLVVLDTVRAQNLPLYGYGRDTAPVLSRVAASGVRFEWAMATAPWTAPSHASVFMGRLPHEVCAARYQRCSDSAPTLAAFLRDHGYRTAGFVGNSKMATAELGFGRGFDWYRDHPRDASEVARHAVVPEWMSNWHGLRRTIGMWELLGRYGGDAVIAEAAAWVTRQGPEPWFAFVNLFDAHDPYLPPEPWASRFARGPRQDPWLTRQATTGPRMTYDGSHLQAELDAYDGAVAFVDSRTGVLLDRLRQAGALDHTLVIITSDHGEEFGEEGRVGHGRALTPSLLHVPLVMVWPGRIPPGTTCVGPVTLADLPATVAHAAVPAASAPFPGRSLARCWDSAVTGGAARPVIAELGPARSVTSGPWHYVRQRDGRETLYDLRDAPPVRSDRGATPDGRGVLPGLRALAGRADEPGSQR
jgi:arylsulfatase A-like enzyme